ncbi:UBC core domain-containing protein [Caenorhabditis elegans]|uniref:UBC core domain-containing protein n=1 Tax=Caenorhabditis elegans TaxID=6239 RepID=Q9N490_CAEEL|nr:UBC core domain-containing protein [Caenorhabditis elegans]CCD73701.1 UBC core domain-containing protein [Caenorhabditis elegans]|eukprot:NP_494397.1 UBiquitin Conjugating enzyme [Caenorhabditis elegans]
MLNLGPGVSVPAAGTASSSAVRRLQKDYAKLMQDPVDGIKALPNEDNILEWHYCLRGSPDTPFYGGYYWGKVIFKENFPWSPPAITMITPNGRFQTNTRLCLSISDYHPESWNPGWTVSAILIGLHSFMNENSPAAGSIAGTPQDQRMYAAASKEFNVKVYNWNLAGNPHCNFFLTRDEEKWFLGHGRGADKFHRPFILLCFPPVFFCFSSIFPVFSY